MTEANVYPLLMQPALHTRVWGGRRLETTMGKVLPDEQPYGESWEMHDTALIANGPLAGKSVREALDLLGERLVGPGHNPADGMPLLAKILDANDWLSVQVHPNDAQAREFEGEPRGKTEAWYVIDATPGATLVAGVQAGTPREALADAIQQGRLEPLLVYQQVAPGDMLFIDAGTIHALGPGLLIYEIQQSSDLTYRLYDWNRMGLDGKPRALHIDKGLAVSNIERAPGMTQHGGSNGAEVALVRSPFFNLTRHDLHNAPAALDTAGQRFHILTSIAGEAHIDYNGGSLALPNGTTALIPAALGRYQLRGSGKVLLASL